MNLNLFKHKPNEIPESIKNLSPAGLKAMPVEPDGFIPLSGSDDLVSLPRHIQDYAAEVGDLWMTSIVSPALFWATRVIPEARICLAKPTPGSTDSDELIFDHPFVDRVRHPSKNWTLSALLSATVVSYLCDGNAYWRKRRNGANNGGAVVELEYLPHYAVEPKSPSDGSEWISHYEYRNSRGFTERIPPQDIIHFRYGMDPRDRRKGMSPLRAQLAEIAGDSLAARWIDSLLKHSGVPSLIVQDKSEMGLDSTADANAIKERIENLVSGRNIGRVLVTSGDLEVQKLAFSPGEFAVADLRKVFESRVCAGLGVSTVVLSFLAGLENSTDNKQGEYHKAAWTGFVLPMLRTFGETLETSLLPEYGNVGDLYVTWDTSKVEALQESRNDASTRAVQVYSGGVAKRNEARRIAGLEEDTTDPKGDMYYERPASVFDGLSTPAKGVQSDRVLKSFLAAYQSREGGM